MCNECWEILRQTASQRKSSSGRWRRGTILIGACLGKPAPPKKQIFQDFVLNRGWVGVKSPKLLMTLYNSHVYIAFQAIRFLKFSDGYSEQVLNLRGGLTSGVRRLGLSLKNTDFFWTFPFCLIANYKAFQNNLHQNISQECYTETPATLPKI